MVKIPPKLRNSFIFKVLKKTKNQTGSFLRNFYENSIAGFLARYLPFLYYPLYLYYSKKNICFVFNIADAPGHFIPELDFFFRCIHLSLIDRNKKYVLLRKNTSFSQAIIYYYSHKFHWAKANTFKYYLILPMLIRYSKITFDAGYCRIRWQAPEKAPYNLHPKLPFIYQRPKSEGAKRLAKMFKLRKQSYCFFPLLEFFNNTPSLLLEKMGLQEKKYCLIHIKEHVCNATALKTNPTTYIKSLNFLKKQGLSLVFVGREAMPIEFKNLGIINYANSKFATFENDILLFKNAYLSITGGSGINMLGDYFNTPVLYLNSWHLSLQFFHATSVCIPSRVRKKNGSFLTFAQQTDLFFANETELNEIFPHKQFEAVNATSEEIYEGLRELLDVINHKKPKDPLYDQYVATCNRYDLLTHCDSRINAYFLHKYRDLL